MPDDPPPPPPTATTQTKNTPAGQVQENVPGLVYAVWPVVVVGLIKGLAAGSASHAPVLVFQNSKANSVVLYLIIPAAPVGRCAVVPAGSVREPVVSPVVIGMSSAAAVTYTVALPDRFSRDPVLLSFSVRAIVVPEEV